MGKGKGKKGRKEAKLAAKKANEVPKIPGLPKPSNPVKKAKKIASRDKKSAMNTNPPGPADFPIPMGRPKPFTKSAQHAKWPALFKKHLSVIEAHIRGLDRIMQSMKVDMQTMGEKERLEFELGEKGNWRVICDMMDRAREVLSTAREAARGILPSRALRDKKGLGVAGTNFEPLGPQLSKRAEELGYDPLGKGGLGRHLDTMDDDGDTDMTDASDSSDSNSDSDSDSDSTSTSDSDEDKVAGGADFVSLKIKKEIPHTGEAESHFEDNDDKLSDPSPLFFVDTKGTPVDFNSISATTLSRAQLKKQKRVELAEARAMKKAKKVEEKEARIAAAKAAEGPGKNKKCTVTVEDEFAPVIEPEATKEPIPGPKLDPVPEVDFVALEARLKAEVDAAAKAQAKAEEAANEEKKAKKKRRRSSGADGEAETAEKKVRREEKEKKRKADESESARDEVDGGKKKKRKHKLEASEA